MFPAPPDRTPSTTSPLPRKRPRAPTSRRSLPPVFPLFCRLPSSPGPGPRLLPGEERLRQPCPPPAAPSREKGDPRKRTGRFGKPFRGLPRRSPSRIPPRPDTCPPSPATCFSAGFLKLPAGTGLREVLPHRGPVTGQGSLPAPRLRRASRGGKTPRRSPRRRKDPRRRPPPLPGPAPETCRKPFPPIFPAAPPRRAIPAQYRNRPV